MSSALPANSEDAFMARALARAARGEGHTRPNPPVGAVVVRDGRVVGEGEHRRCGGDHAEVAALKDALRRSGMRTGKRDILALLAAAPPRFFEGCHVYVTLEPCSRPGRVGACCDALAAAGVSRVVWAVADPNPVNRGRAARRLRAAGIETACWEKDRAHRAVVSRAQTLIAPFAKRIATGRPYVTVKLAMSLDGRICDVSGRSKWMSSPHARRVTGDYRARVDVVLVGAETVRKDDPSLLCHTRENPDLWRAVISRSGKLPRGARIFTDAAASRTLVYRDVASAIEDLGRRGFLHVFCEGGLVLARALADAGLVDQWIHVQCPFVLGESPLGRAWRFTAFSPSGYTPQAETIARFSAPRRG